MQVSHAHLGDYFFMFVQSSMETNQMTDCTHPSLGHNQGEQPFLSRLGLVLILKAVETKG